MHTIFKKISATFTLSLLVECAIVQSETLPSTPSAPLSEKESLTKLIADNNDFAFKFYAEMSKKKGNIFISPISISTALSMTYAGAAGETAEQMKNALSFSLPRENLFPTFKTLSQKINKKNSSHELCVVNSIWPYENYKFKDDFIALLKNYYGIEIQYLNYNKPQEACEIVNKWIEEKTKDKIKSLLSAPPVDELTRLILVNAIYFKGQWTKEFDKKNTTHMPFKLSPQENINVSMMNKKMETGYFEDEDLQVLCLPYKGNEISFYAVLPKKDFGIDELEQKLDSAKFTEIKEKILQKDVKIFLPKFKVTVSSSLNKYFKQLGMTDAFNKKADFSGMDGTQDLYITAILHKAFVELNEEGAEAAAATAVVMNLRCALPEPTPIFNADHPFIFLICGKDGEIFFMGRISNPMNEENQL
jgi:serpin B